MIVVAPNGQKVIRAAILGGLSELGDTSKVSTQLPEPPPASFVVVSRIGGGESNFATDAPRFLVECYATTELVAEDLANKVSAALKWARGRQFAGAWVRWWEDDGNLARFPNPDVKHFRFQFTGELSLALQ